MIMETTKEKEALASAKKKLKEFKKHIKGSSSSLHNKSTLKEPINSLIPKFNMSGSIDESMEELRSSPVSSSIVNGSSTVSHQSVRSSISPQIVPVTRDADTGGDNSMSSNHSTVSSSNQSSLIHYQTNLLSSQSPPNHHQVNGEISPKSTTAVEEQSVLITSLQDEISSLKEKLQVNIQTVGMLVAEKSELQAQAKRNEKLAKKRMDEIEELSGRLQASRQCVTDLEKSFTSANNSSQILQQVNKDQTNEIDRLKLEIYKAGKTNEEGDQKIEELSQRLSNKNDECSQLEISINDLQSQLEMAQIQIQQVSLNHSSPQSVKDDNDDSDSESSPAMNKDEETIKHSTSQLSMMNEQKIFLESELEKISARLETLVHERDQILMHSQHLQNQHQEEVKQQEENFMKERENLISKALFQQQESELHSCKRELEEAILKLSNASDIHERQDECDKLQKELSALRQSVEEKAKDYTNTISELENECHTRQLSEHQLTSKLIERKNQINELETRIAQLVDDSEARKRILEETQSDKTALSRALTQNQQLKEQLIELQSGFVKMSEENMSVMTKMESVEHQNVELTSLLTKRDLEVASTREQLRSLKTDLEDSQKNVTALNASLKDYDSVKRQIAEFSSYRNLVENLKSQLLTAQQTVKSLTDENSQLKLLTQQQQSVSTASTSATSGEEKDEISKEVSVYTVDSSVQTDIKLYLDATSMSSISDKPSIVRDKAIQVAMTFDNISFNSSMNRNIPVVYGDDVTMKTPQQQSDANFSGAASIVPNDGNLIEHIESRETIKRPISPLVGDSKAIEALEKKYEKAVKDKVDLLEKVDQLEYRITVLESEADTVGDYISLYQHQRNVMHKRELEKDQYISKILFDSENHKAKLRELQQHVINLIRERDQLLNSVNRRRKRRQLLYEANDEQTKVSSDKDESISVTSENIPSSLIHPTLDDSDVSKIIFHNANSQDITNHHENKNNAINNLIDVKIPNGEKESSNDKLLKSNSNVTTMPSPSVMGNSLKWPNYSNENDSDDGEKSLSSIDDITSSLSSKKNNTAAQSNIATVLTTTTQPSSSHKGVLLVDKDRIISPIVHYDGSTSTVESPTFDTRRLNDVDDDNSNNDTADQSILRRHQTTKQIMTLFSEIEHYVTPENDYIHCKCCEGHKIVLI